MTQYWMITDRNVRQDRLGGVHAGLTYWLSDEEELEHLDRWRRCTPAQFRASVVRATEQFPSVDNLEDNERQQHVTLFVHGYNVDWQDAVKRYHSLCASMFQGADQQEALGICILFSWPSDGMVTNYLPDRADARASAPDLADVLSSLYDWMLDRQVQGAKDPANSCRAKTSLIAHSMGNYVLQNAMQLAWTRKNRPLLVSLINQLVMVAADVDNDLFDDGEAVTGGDGDAIANLSYRVTALYSGRDPVLGMSAGLKHFGKRRLGRSGLANPERVPDNVCQFDCSALFKPKQAGIHSAYFEEPRTIELMKQLLRGVDRGVIAVSG